MRCLTVCLTAVSIVCGAVDLGACGDKFLRLAARLGPGYTAQYRATVLIYRPPDSIVPAAASRLGLKQSLQRAGHHVYSVDRANDLIAALAVRPYDIVIGDAADSAALVAALTDAQGRPTFLPVFHKESKRQLEEARRQRRCLIRSGDRAYHAVAEIDHVMSLRGGTSVSP